MSVSLYDVSIPIFTLTLNNLSAILDKAASHEEAKKVDPKVLPAARLIADMLPLSSQIQIACDTVKGAAARLSCTDIPKHKKDSNLLESAVARESFGAIATGTGRPGLRPARGDRRPVDIQDQAPIGRCGLQADR